jgi:hypothetical protein
MDKATRKRWALLLTASAITTVAAIFAPDGSNLPDFSRQPKPVAPVRPVAPLQATPSADGEAFGDEPDDPFAPRGWQVLPAPPPPAAVVAAAPAPVQPSAPAGPPPLPFKFMGRMNDDGKQVIYLSHGDQMLVARDGETLETSYKVVAVEARHIDFEYTPTGEKQTLEIPAADN